MKSLWPLLACWCLFLAVGCGSESPKSVREVSAVIRIDAIPKDFISKETKEADLEKIHSLIIDPKTIEAILDEMGQFANLPAENLQGELIRLRLVGSISGQFDVKWSRQDKSHLAEVRLYLPDVEQAKTMLQKTIDQFVATHAKDFKATIERPVAEGSAAQ